MVSSGTLSVLALSAVMFIASFSAGTLPLAMSLSHGKMNLVTSLGIGLLVGTSLGVVLPEGIEMLYASDSLHAHIHNRYRRAEAGIPDAVHRIAPHESGHSNHLPMALALVSGYLVMHLLTFLPPLLLSKKSASSMPLTPLSSSPRLERVPSPNPALIDTPKSLSNTTIGLCIHALADGVALGSSAASNNLAIQGIVFFAIMLHKAPASFSLTAILLREGYPRHLARRQLFLFALSSPSSTLLTYFIIASISLNQQNISFWSGVFLLFSAGTLIFASTNVHIHATEEDEVKETPKLSLADMIASGIGMCIPMVLGSLGHGD